MGYASCCAEPPELLRISTSLWTWRRHGFTLDTHAAIKDWGRDYLLQFAYGSTRPRDQEDIRGILAANHEALDLEWVRREWSQIADVTDETAPQFETMVREFYEGR